MREDSGASLRTALILQAGLYLLVASIPFEYPERTIPLEIPTLTGAIFLLSTLLHPQRCYGRVPSAALWFGVYLVVFLISVVTSRSEYSAEAISEYVIVVQGVLVFLAAFNLMRDETVAVRTLVTLVAACGVRATLPLVGFARTTSAVWTGGERVSALGQNANNAAMILAAGLVALVGLAFMSRRKDGWRLALTGLLAALLGFAVLETGSRGGLAALLAGLLVFALAADTLRSRLRNGTIAMLAISLLVVATLRLPMMKNRLEESMKTGDLAGREQLYPALWTMFLEKPVLGWGPANNTYELALRVGQRDRPKRAAHNSILELLTASWPGRCHSLSGGCLALGSKRLAGPARRAWSPAAGAPWLCVRVQHEWRLDRIEAAMGRACLRACQRQMERQGVPACHTSLLQPTACGV